MPLKSVSLSSGSLGTANKSVKMDIRPTIVLLSPRMDPEDDETEAARQLRRGSLIGDGLYSTRL
jgi:hypothetical protein